MNKKNPRRVDLDTKDNQVCLVTRVPAWFKVTAFGEVRVVNVGDPGSWVFYKETTANGEMHLHVMRTS
jgi:hypothetical protein